MKSLIYMAEPPVKSRIIFTKPIEHISVGEDTAPSLEARL